MGMLLLESFICKNLQASTSICKPCLLWLQGLRGQANIAHAAVAMLWGSLGGWKRQRVRKSPTILAAQAYQTCQPDHGPFLGLWASLKAHRQRHNVHAGTWPRVMYEDHLKAKVQASKPKPQPHCQPSPTQSGAAAVGLWPLMGMRSACANDMTCGVALLSLARG